MSQALAPLSALYAEKDGVFVNSIEKYTRAV